MSGDLYELIDLAAGWRMPIRVTWLNVANAEVTFAEIPMLKIQRGAVAKKLLGACTHTGEGRWWIPKLSLEAIATKAADGTDPERLVRWSTPEPGMSADADFVHAYCKQEYVPTILRNPAAAIPVWASFEKFILQWLLQGRSLKFSFGRLDAFPVRANWKNAMIGRIFKNAEWQDHYSKEHYDFLRRTITQNPEMITAYDKDSDTMRWSVEFTPNKSFHAAAEKIERARKTNHRWKNNYLGQICQVIKETIIDRLHENLVAYCKETNYPYAIFPDGSSCRYPPKGFQPTRFGTSWYQTPFVTGAALKGYEGSALVQEDAGLHALSNIRPEAQDVRQRDDVDGARKD